MRQKTCKVCKGKFIPDRPLQSCCSIPCAIEHGRKQKDKKDRADIKLAKERLKTRQEWANDAQVAFNAYIRERDKGQPCISCGKSTGCKVNAGHYLSRGARPELRYEPLNCHLQCEKCNSWLSGNAVAYRINLIKKIGQDKVDWLEGPHDPKKYTIDELKQIKKEYTAKRKALEKEKPG